MPVPLRIAAGAAAGILVLASAVSGGLCYQASEHLLAPSRTADPRAGLDPQSAYGMAFETVAVPGPLGPAAAWYVPGHSGRWAIVVHGLGAPMAEALPLLPVLHRLGDSVLVISYRNDPEAPKSPDGLSHLGADEWRDLDAGVAFARRHSARRVVLVGYSLGGAMVCDLLRHSARAGVVDRVVLDSPVLEWRRPLAAAAARAGLPAALVAPTEAMIEWRAKIDLGDEDQLAHAGELSVPILILHGTADPVVPIADSRLLQARRPDLVTMVEFRGAGHAGSWSADPARYAAAVRRFLAAPVQSLSRRGSSVMMPSTPSDRIRDTATVSFTVHANTRPPLSWTASSSAGLARLYRIVAAAAPGPRPARGARPRSLAAALPGLRRL